MKLRRVILPVGVDGDSDNPPRILDLNPPPVSGNLPETARAIDAEEQTLP